MSGKRKRLYYRLTPVYEPEPGAAPQIRNAAVVTCMATGRLLDSGGGGGGGGGLALCPELVDALDGRGGNSGIRLILSDTELDVIRRGLRLSLAHYLKCVPQGEEDEVDKMCRGAIEAATVAAAGRK